jgi:hypothetical protein
MSYGPEAYEAGIDYFYFENGYYHRVRVTKSREQAAPLAA